MQQHPIPQNVTQYQFRLVGDMTLKQFLELALGMGLAYIFYASNLIFIFKWPLAIASLFLGIALAFFPIEERPLDVWIINFLRSIYAPTRFVWKKTTKLPALFTFVPHEIIEKITATKTVKAPPLSSRSVPAPDLSDTEQEKLKGLDSLLLSAESKIHTTPPPPTPKKPQVVVRKLKASSIIFDSKTPSHSPTHPKPQAPAEQKSLTIPAPKSISLSPDKAGIPPADTPSPTAPLTAAPSIKKLTPVNASGAADQISLPASPKQENVVVGMIVDRSGRLVNSAIVQILNQDGLPARAIKTNSLGQFSISTPLPAGEYVLEVEVDGLTFPPKQLKVANQIIPPLLLRAS